MANATSVSNGLGGLFTFFMVFLEQISRFGRKGEVTQVQAGTAQRSWRNSFGTRLEVCSKWCFVCRSAKRNEICAAVLTGESFRATSSGFFFLRLAYLILMQMFYSSALQCCDQHVALRRSLTVMKSS